MKYLDSIFNKGKKFIVGGIFLGACLFGNPKEANGQFERIGYSDENGIISVVGLKKEGDNCYWSQLTREKEKNVFFTYTRIDPNDKNKTRLENIKINSDNTLNYRIEHTNNFFETCEWAENREYVCKKINGKKEDFSAEQQERIKQLLNININFDYDRKGLDFLIQETNKWSKEYSRSDIDNYRISYYKINKEKFPSEMRIFIEKENREYGISWVYYSDIDQDKKYEDISIGTVIEGDNEKTRKEQIFKNYNGTINYSSPEFNVTNKKIEDFTPSLQEKIKKVLEIENMLIKDYQNSEAIPFLYEEYKKWVKE